MSSYFDTHDDDSLCEDLMVDLSCLVDGELDEEAAGRVMVKLETSPSCRQFFDDLRLQVRLHKDAADPDRLFARIATLGGGSLAEEAENIDLVHRLATIFYQLGKAYVLTAIDPDFRTRVFEQAVAVESTQSRGRGFVDGILQGGRDAETGVDWQSARKVLNGRLERIEDPMEKGRRLLEEAVDVESDHEEARLYLAFLHASEGRRVLAADEYREVFHSAVDQNNRGHAVIQLGRLYSADNDFRRAAICFRWVTMSGLADADDRFFVARFNLGMMYAHMGLQNRSLQWFRELVDRHPGRLGEVAHLFANSPRLRETIDSQPGFGESLVGTCPELFRQPDQTQDHSEGSVE